MPPKSNSFCVCKQIFLSLGAPKTVVSIYDLSKLSEHGIVISKLGKVCKCGKGHGNVIVNKLFASGDLVEVDNGVYNRIKTANVSYHCGRIDLASAHHLNGLDHIVGVTSGVGADVGKAVVNVIEVEHCGECGVDRSCKEVKTAVKSEHAVAKLNNGLDGGVNEYVVKSLVVGEGHKVIVSVFYLVGVNVQKLNAVLCSLLNRNDGCCSVETRGVDVGYNEKGRFSVAVDLPPP